MLNETPNNTPENNNFENDVPEALEIKSSGRKIKSYVALALAVIIVAATFVAALAVVLKDTNNGEENSSLLVVQSQEVSAFSEISLPTESLFESSEPEQSEPDQSSEPEEIFPVINVVTPVNVTAAAIYESNSLYCIYQDNADTRLSVASITKLVTASVALKYMPADTVVAVGSELRLVKSGSSVCGLKKGYKLTLEQLLYGMLMSSGNDAAYTVAVSVARYVSENADMKDKEAVEYFCGLMNSLANEIGAVNSSFANPEGWDDENNYSTVNDLAIIAKHAKSLPLIANISATVKYSTVIASGEEMKFFNSNFLLHKDGDFYSPNVTGLKTGSTKNAGKCLVTTVNIDGYEYIAVVMGCPDEETRYNSMLSLISYIEEYHLLKFA